MGDHGIYKLSDLLKYCHIKELKFVLLLTFVKLMNTISLSGNSISDRGFVYMLGTETYNKTIINVILDRLQSSTEASAALSVLSLASNDIKLISAAYAKLSTAVSQLR